MKRKVRRTAGAASVKLVAMMLWSTLLVPAAVHSAVRMVDPESRGCVEGASGTYVSIQAAINDAAQGDEVAICYNSTTYHENLIINKSGISLVGYYDPLLGENQPVVDGTMSGSTVSVKGLSGSNVTDVTIQNLSIVNGGSTTDTSLKGGGVHLSYTDNVKIVSCTISNNKVNTASSNCYGGGIYAVFSSGLRITNSTISENDAYCGGGLYIGTGCSDAVVSGCDIRRNYAKNGGGGIYGSSADLILKKSFLIENDSHIGGGAVSVLKVEGCYFIANTANYGGGLAMLNHTGNQWLIDSVFYGNYAQNAGGAILVYYNAIGQKGFVDRCTIICNTTAGTGPAIFVGYYMPLEVRWSIFSGTQLDMIIGESPDSTIVGNVWDHDCDYCFPNLNSLSTQPPLTQEGLAEYFSPSSCADTVADQYSESDMYSRVMYPPQGTPIEDARGTTRPVDYTPARPDYDIGAIELFPDLDADGYDVRSDCDDSQAAINPGMTEIIGDGIDQNCNSISVDSVQYEKSGGGTLTVTASRTDGESHQLWLQSPGVIDPTMMSYDAQNLLWSYSETGLHGCPSTVEVYDEISEVTDNVVVDCP